MDHNSNSNNNEGRNAALARSPPVVIYLGFQLTLFVSSRGRHRFRGMMFVAGLGQLHDDDELLVLSNNSNNNQARQYEKVISIGPNM